MTSTISKSTIYENTVQDDTDAAEAGGISNRGTKMTITDTEFSGNAAMGDTMEAAYGGALSNCHRLRAHRSPQPVRFQLRERSDRRISSRLQEPSTSPTAL